MHILPPLETVKDIAATLAEDGERIETNPERLQKVDDRLNTLYSLCQKHRAADEGELIALRDRYAAQLAAIEADTQKAKGGLAGTVLVSDGFFPFRDGVDVCIAQGVTAIAQPGGSLRDYEVIGAVNEASPQVAMVFTGQRSFKH